MKIIDWNVSSRKTEKIQILAGVLYSSTPISFLQHLLHCWACPREESRASEPGKARAGLPHASMRSFVPHTVTKWVWWTLGAAGMQPGAGRSRDKPGLHRFGPFPRRWEGRKEASKVLQGGVQRPPWGPVWSGERWVLNCHSTGIAHHSWNRKIRICQCVI